MKCVALSTKATFSYIPTTEEINKFIATKRNIKVSDVEKMKLSTEEIE